MSFASRVNKERPFSMAWASGTKNEPVEEREREEKQEEGDKVQEIWTPPVITTDLEIPERFKNVKPMTKDEIRAYFNGVKEAGVDVSILPVPSFLEDEDPATYTPEITPQQLEHQRQGEHYITRLLNAKTDEEKREIMRERQAYMDKFKVGKKEEQLFMMPIQF